MLVLCRRINEQIVVGDLITITVVSIKGTTVRIAIDAPKDIPVHRKEVYDAIRIDQGGFRSGQPEASEANPINGHGIKFCPTHDPGRGFPPEVQDAIHILARFLGPSPGTTNPRF